MKYQESEDMLEVLACDIEKRPQSAPAFLDVQQHVVSVERSAGALIVVFDAEASDDVAALVEAERLCCSDISWLLEVEPRPRLHILASTTQLDVIAHLIQPD